jgi:thiol-disulfide isomerase/thioredoxin
MCATALVAYALVACAGAAPARKSSAVAEPLPALTLPLLDGGTWSSTSARGSALVIDVWASWCKPCSKGFPKLNALAARRSDVVVVAISLDEEVAAARDFLAQFPLAVVVARDDEQILTRPPLAIARLPTLLIVDSAGVIRHRIEEPSEPDYDRLDELIAAP